MGSPLTVGSGARLLLRAASVKDAWVRVPASTLAITPLPKTSISLAPGDDACVLLVVEQPAQQPGNYSAPSVGTTEPPDGFLVRTAVPGGAEVPGPALDFVALSHTGAEGRAAVTVYVGVLRSLTVEALVRDSRCRADDCVSSGDGGSVGGGNDATTAAALVSVRIEHRAWAWNVEGGTQTPLQLGQPWAPLHAAVHVALLAPLLNRVSSTTAPRPLCLTADEPGRWVRWPMPGSLRLPAGMLGSGGRDLFWAPYNCTLREFSLDDVASCFSEAGVQNSSVLMLGDSNVRRDWKTLTGYAVSHVPPLGSPERDALPRGESAWCVRRRADAVCECEDSEERGFWGADTMNADGMYQTYAASVLWRGAGSGTVTLVYDRFPGLLLTEENVLYHHTFVDTFLRRSAAPNVTYLAVVFDCVHWDYVFGTALEFASALEQLIAILVDSYPDPRTRIIYRTPNYYVGHTNIVAPPYAVRSTTRLLQFHKLALEALRGSVLAPRLEVWDVFALSEGLPLSVSDAERARCPTNHFASQLLDISATILLNALCNAPRSAPEPGNP